MACLRYILITMVLLSLHSSQAEDAFYELRDETSCAGVGTEHENVDIYCVLEPSAASCSSLSNAEIKWFYSSSNSRRAIANDDKYGIWDEFDSSQAGERSSLLRVRRIDQDADTGTFTCSLFCDGSLAPVTSRKMELCVQDEATKLIICDHSTSEDMCSHVFANGECTERCDTEDQLFDGGDCDAYGQRFCTNSDCLTHYNDGICNRNCSSSECGFDGGDCLLTTESITRETLSVVIPASYMTRQINHLTMQMSILLSTLVELHGEATMWTGKTSDNKETQITYLNPRIFQEAHDNLKMLKYKLVPQSCQSNLQCFHRVRNAAKYISHHLIISNEAINSSIAVIGINSNVDHCKRRTDNSPSSSGSRNQDKASAGQATTDSLPKVKSSLGAGEIVGIALCGIALVVLVIGIIIACQYRRIALSRHKSETIQKQSHIKDYIDSIPTNLSSYDGGSSSDGPKSPQSSIARSITSKDTILPRTTSRSPNYGTDDIHTSNA